GTLTFAPGETTRTVAIQVMGDPVYEPTERFIVRLSNPVNATIARGQGSGLIVDDDPVPSVGLSLTGSPFAENDGLATITASLSNPSSLPVTVSLVFAGSASLPADYTASGSQIVIPSGAISGSITLTGVPDSVVEGDESVVVGILGVSAGASI